MDVVIHNAEEAVKACFAQIRWVTDAIAAQITDFDAPIYLPPDSVLENAVSDAIYKVEEVPCGWVVFHGFGIPNFAKQMRETGKVDDWLRPIGGDGPYLVNRWTGEIETFYSPFLFPTWNAAIQNYIYHLPEDQRIACRLPEFRTVWEPDPIRFCPPILDKIELEKIDDIEDIRFALEIDEAGQNLLVGGEINVAGMAPFHGQPPYLRACSVVDVKQEGATKIYILKPEFDMARLRSRGGFGDRINLSTCESEIFPDGVSLYFQVQIGN